jgi:hypothetical protein
LNLSLRFDLRSNFLSTNYKIKRVFLGLETRRVLRLFAPFQDEYKRTLHFQNDTESKCGVLKTSHLHQSKKKDSKFCLK